MLHDDPGAFTGTSEAEMTEVVAESVAWTTKMREQGRYLRGDKLSGDPGRVLSENQGGVVVQDGPYGERGIEIREIDEI